MGEGGFAPATFPFTAPPSPLRLASASALDGLACQHLASSVGCWHRTQFLLQAELASPPLESLFATYHCITTMADPEQIHFDFNSRPNDPAYQQQYPFDTLSFQDVLVEDADLWPLPEGFFDSPGDPATLSVSDNFLQIDALEPFGQSDNSIADQFFPPAWNSHATSEHGTDNSDGGDEEWAPDSQDLENVGGTPFASNSEQA